MSEIQRWTWTPTGMEPYREHPLDVGGVFVRSEELLTSPYKDVPKLLEAAMDNIRKLEARIVALEQEHGNLEAQIFYCPQAHTIYVEGGRTSDDDIPCPHCNRDRWRTWAGEAKKAFDAFQFNVSYNLIPGSEDVAVDASYRELYAALATYPTEE